MLLRIATILSFVGKYVWHFQYFPVTDLWLLKWWLAWIKSSDSVERTNLSMCCHWHQFYDSKPCGFSKLHWATLVKLIKCLNMFFFWFLWSLRSSEVVRSFQPRSLLESSGIELWLGWEPSFSHQRTELEVSQYIFVCWPPGSHQPGCAFLPSLPSLLPLKNSY